MDSVFFQTLTDFCHNYLVDSNKFVYSYLRNRGISYNTIKEFKLGAFPSDLRKLFEKIHPEELRNRNIVYCADKSVYQNYPLVIPIRDVCGNTVAIGCRWLKSEDERNKLNLPKYRNSSFVKGNVLFGLDKAIPYIRKANKAYVVEGYFDAITAHQYQMKNVVASCGTSFNNRQLMLLSRYTENVCILFDNDGPGRMNAEKVMNKLGKNGEVKLTYAFTPSAYKDLDEYIRNNGSLDYFEV